MFPLRLTKDVIRPLNDKDHFHLHDCYLIILDTLGGYECVFISIPYFPQLMERTQCLLNLMNKSNPVFLLCLQSSRLQRDKFH